LLIEPEINLGLSETVEAGTHVILLVKPKTWNIPSEMFNIRFIKNTKCGCANNYVLFAFLRSITPLIFQASELSGFSSRTLS